ncbi:MAG: DNA-directed RNA polymerase subunit omega [Candidatus Acidiferrales bacterium]|jgi:DNA-directed RNA polymerase omega subunit
MAETKVPQNQFAYVVVASRRARQLMAGAPPMVDNPRTLKATRLAMEELDQSVLEYEYPGAPGPGEDKEGKRRKG